MSSNDNDKRNGLPLIGLSLGTFGLGLYIAAREHKRERLSAYSLILFNVKGHGAQNLVPTPRLQKPPSSPVVYAFKALGVATVIVGIAAVWTVKSTTWYLDVHNACYLSIITNVGGRIPCTNERDLFALPTEV